MRCMILAAALMGLPFPLQAQTGNPAGMAPGTQQSAPGKPAPGQTNTTDELFARLAASGGLAEVDLGTLAGKKGRSDAVKAFAKQMVDDHSKTNGQLVAAVKNAGIVLPQEPDAEHQAIRTQLDKLDQAAFDVAYVSGQAQDHIKMSQLLQWEIGSGQDGDIRHFAAEALPAVLAHLQMAQDLLVRLRSEASR